MLFKHHSAPQNSEHCSLFLYLLRCFGALSIVVLFVGCQPQASRNEATFSGAIMGTDYRIKVVLDGSNSIAKEYLESLDRQILEVLSKVDAAMSTYKADSEVSRFNRLGALVPVQLSDLTAPVVSEALSVSRLTGGAFDITIAPAVDAWGFGPDGKVEQQPDPQQLADLRSSVGYQKLQLAEGHLSKLHAATSIDLSAIAKGYAIDQLADLLQSLQHQDYLINVGGELRASGTNINGHQWSVAIEKPQVLGGVQEVIELDNAAIATSGDYRNYVVIDGQQFSHLIDPVSLNPIRHKLASVSVISSKASTADALATALLVMGETRGLEFAQQHEIAAYFIIRGAATGQFSTKITPNFAAKIK